MKVTFEELASHTLDFLGRVDLKGAEVPAFNRVCVFLGAIKKGDVLILPKEEDNEQGDQDDPPPED